MLTYGDSSHRAGQTGLLRSVGDQLRARALIGVARRAFSLARQALLVTLPGCEHLLPTGQVDAAFADLRGIAFLHRSVANSPSPPPRSNGLQRAAETPQHTGEEGAGESCCGVGRDLELEQVFAECACIDDCIVPAPALQRSRPVGRCNAPHHPAARRAHACMAPRRGLAPQRIKFRAEDNVVLQRRVQDPCALRHERHRERRVLHTAARLSHFACAQDSIERRRNGGTRVCPV